MFRSTRGPDPLYRLARLPHPELVGKGSVHHRPRPNGFFSETRGVVGGERLTLQLNMNVALWNWGTRQVTGARVVSCFSYCGGDATTAESSTGLGSWLFPISRIVAVSVWLRQGRCASLRDHLAVTLDPAVRTRRVCFYREKAHCAYSTR